VLFLGSELKCTLETSEKAKAFCPISDVGEAKTCLHDADVLSNIIETLRGKYRVK
jgi:hypothetical protein